MLKYKSPSAGEKNEFRNKIRFSIFSIKAGDLYFKKDESNKDSSYDYKSNVKYEVGDSFFFIFLSEQKIIIFAHSPFFSYFKIFN